jgi:hypothetical protein
VSFLLVNGHRGGAAVECWFLALPVGGSFGDEFVGGGDEPVDGGLGEQRVGHHRQPFVGGAVGGHDGGGFLVAFDAQLVEVGGAGPVQWLEGEVIDDPAEHAASRELAAALRRAVTEVLSERQRRVFVAIVVDGVPLDALAIEMGSTRNALYKTVFDVRRKIRAHLVAHGYLDAEGGTP